MMNYEDVKRIRENPTAEDVDNAELHKLIDIAIEKQIPKKLTLKHRCYAGSVRRGICPNCLMTENNNANYCRACGQALDWSDT